MADDILLQKATLAHTGGNLPEAERIYRQILGQAPANPHVHFLLGILLLQSGRFAEAAPLFAKLLELEPDNTEAAMHLALASCETGDIARAEACYQHVISLMPGNVQACFNLAELYQSLGHFDEALALYQEVLRLEPAAADALFNQAVIHFNRKAFTEAEVLYRQFLVLCPASVEAHYNLGAVLQDQGRFSEASEMYGSALRLKPDLFDAYRGIANIHFLHERNYVLAAKNFRRALELRPDDVEMLSNLGVALQKLNRLAESEDCFRRALKIVPEHVNAHFNLGLVLLLQGKFQEGWLEYQWRLRIKNRVMPDLGKPEWDGMACPGKTILVRAEQGFGDTIQFCRYLKRVRELAGRVVLECQVGMQRLLRNVAGVDEIYQKTINGKILAEFDAHIPLLNIPGVLKSDLPDRPTEVPYLSPEPWLAGRWRARFSSDSHLKVGFVWAGRPTHEDDCNRSVMLSDFIKLAKQPGVRLYSLQKGSAVVALSDVSPGFPITNLDAELEDFADTAAAIVNLDLVITVDTSVAHLAGALNRPVWVLLPFAPDWRWLTERDDSPWYPTMRLFRQPQTGDWESVFIRVADELASFAGSWQGGQGEKGTPGYSAEMVCLLEAGWRSHRSGAFAEAVAFSRKILSECPEHIEASWLAGISYVQLGEHASALALLEHAFKTWPEHPGILKNLGITYQVLERHADAVFCYEQALRLGNEEAEVLYNLGTVRLAQNLPREAAGYFERALAYRPNFTEALNNLGLALQRLDDPEAAIRCFQQALQVNADFIDAQLNLGNALSAAGRLAEAESVCRDALSRQPKNAALHNSLGVVFKNRGLLDEAARQFRCALEHDAELTESHNNLGNCLKAMGDLTGAVTCYRNALRIAPDNAGAWNNLGNSLQAQGELDEALACFDRSERLAPNFAEAHWNRAIALLLAGDYKNGWHEYEWGFAAGQRPLRKFTQARWQGGDFSGRTLLVYAEQGFGDTIQFVRFLEQARQRGGAIILECQPELVPLLEPCEWLDKVIPQMPEGPVSECFDLQVPLMSLPSVLDITLQTLPVATSYLSARLDRVAHWKGRLVGDGIKVGVAWSGSPAHQDDRNRSCPLAVFLKLLGAEGVSWYGLQKGVALEELTADSGIRKLGAELQDFAETAAVIANLDLVITVDTAVAHLAGALGKKVWILLPFSPDWRWLTQREDSPWYSTAKLFRQQRAGDWEGVINQVKAALEVVDR